MLTRLTSATLDIDIVVIALVYLLGRHNEIGTGAFALGQGLLMDIFSGGLWGFHSMLYLIIYLFTKFFSRPFDLLSVFGQFTVITTGVLVKGIFLVLLLHLFSLNSNFSKLNFLLFIISAVCSGLIAPVIFFLLDSLGRFYHGAHKDF